MIYLLRALNNAECNQILENIELCDVICGNVPYGGTNSVILDQLFNKFEIYIMVNTALHCGIGRTVNFI